MRDLASAGHLIPIAGQLGAIRPVARAHHLLVIFVDVCCPLYQSRMSASMCLCLAVNVSAVNGLSSTGCRQRAVVNRAVVNDSGRCRQSGCRQRLSSTAVVNTRRFHHRYRLNSGRLILKSCRECARDSEVVNRGVHVNSEL